MKMITIESYRDAKKEYRWRARAANGKIVADSAEGYKRARDRDRIVNRMFFTPQQSFVVVDR